MEPSVLLLLELGIALWLGNGTFIVVGAGRVGNVPDLPLPPGWFARGRCLTATDVVFESIGDKLPAEAT
jgi:hypothetical protein